MPNNSRSPKKSKNAADAVTKEKSEKSNNDLVKKREDHTGTFSASILMIWYLLVIITLWLFSAIAATTITYLYTKNPISFALFTTVAPPAYILFWIVKRIFPEPEVITRLRIETNAQRPTFRFPNGFKY